MATNTEKITIKFEAAGNKAMQLAIMNLDVATKRLTGQTSEYAKHLVGLGLNQKTVNKLLSEQNDLTLWGVRNQRLLGNTFATIRSKLLLYSFAVTLATAAFAKLFKKSMEQEKAERKLATALGKTNTALLNYASTMQKNTEFGDEEIINVNALIAAYTDDEEAIKRATQATVDLAAAKGMDLKAAADLVSKSLGSSTNALSRYGITVKGAVNSTQRLNHLTREISNLYGGQAQEQANTFWGRIEQLKNAAGDLSEEIGETLSPIIKTLAEDMMSTIITFKGFFQSINEFPAETIVRKFEELGIANENLVTMKIIGMQQRLSSTLQDQEKDINRLLTINQGYLKSNSDIADVIDFTTTSAGLLTKGLKAVGFEGAALTLNTDNYAHVLKIAKFQLDETANALQQHEDIGSKDADTTMKRFMALNQLVLMLENYKTTNDDVLAAISALMKESVKLEKENPIKKFFDDLDLKKINEDVDNLKALTDALKSVGDAYMNMEMQSLNQKKQADLAAAGNIRSERKRQKEIDKINEQAAKEERKIRKNNQKFRIMDAIANTAVGVTKALELIFPLNMIVAGLVTAAGAMQVATLKAQKFERGGMVGGRRHSQGGTMIEAERGEFVMSRSAVESVGMETMNRINQGGGAGISISFSGNVMSDEFIESEAIPKIKEAIRRGADIGVS